MRHYYKKLHFISFTTLVIACFTILPLSGFSQDGEKKAIWLPFKNFIGTWKGKCKQMDTFGLEELKFTYIMNGACIEVKCKIDYEADPLSPKGHTEESIGYINYDSGRKVYVYRQFDDDGTVYQLKLISAIDPTNTLLEFCDERPVSEVQRKEIFRINKKMELNHKTQVKFKDVPDKRFITFPESVLKKL